MCLFLYNCNSCFVAWRVESCDESPFEFADESFLQAFEVGRCAVGCQYDLFSVVVESVESVEELFLGVFPFAEELYVVDDQNVDGSKLVLELREVSLFDCVDEIVYEFFAA